MRYKQETGKTVIAIPLYNSKRRHPKLRELLGVFLYCIKTGVSSFEEKIPENKNVFIYDLSSYLHHHSITAIDINSLYHANELEILDIEKFYPSSYYIYKRENYDYDGLFPLEKHLEVFDTICQEIVENITGCNLKDGKILSDYINTFNCIEDSGLYTKEGTYEFTHYNIYTSTTRPSNAWNKNNYAALTKEDKERFRSRFDEKGLFVSYDFNSYHPHLLAKIVGYDFGQDDAYEHLSKYFGETREKTKPLVMRQLYGGVKPEYIDIPYFNKANELSLQLRKLHKKRKLESPIFKRNIHWEKLPPYKIINYYIQLFETECNIVILRDILDFLKDYKSKLILYTYDSFLIDFNLDDGKDVIIGIKEIMENICPVHVSVGKRYDDMKIKQI